MENYVRSKYGQWPIQVWQVTYEKNRFKFSIFVEGTEPEMRAYLNSEMGFVGSYHACTKDEVKAARLLRFPIYIAPELDRTGHYQN